MYCPFKKLDHIYNENIKTKPHTNENKNLFPAPNTYYIDQNHKNKYEIQ